jgi:hypothetical protein
VELPELLKAASNWGICPRKDLDRLGATLTATLQEHRPGKSIVLGKFTLLVTLCQSLNSVLACGGSAFRKRVAEKVPKHRDIRYRELEYQPEDAGGGRSH